MRKGEGVPVALLFEPTGAKRRDEDNYPIDVVTYLLSEVELVD